MSRLPPVLDAAFRITVGRDPVSDRTLGAATIAMINNMQNLRNQRDFLAGLVASGRAGPSADSGGFEGDFYHNQASMLLVRIRTAILCGPIFVIDKMTSCRPALTGKVNQTPLFACGLTRYGGCDE